MRWVLREYSFYFVSIVLNIWTFIFSSRRRHTICYRDWSSDVCSSDLRPWVRAHSCPSAGRPLVARGAGSRGRRHGGPPSRDGRRPRGTPTPPGRRPRGRSLESGSATVVPWAAWRGLPSRPARQASTQRSDPPQRVARLPMTVAARRRLPPCAVQADHDPLVTSRLKVAPFEQPFDSPSGLLEGHAGLGGERLVVELDRGIGPDMGGEREQHRKIGAGGVRVPARPDLDQHAGDHPPAAVLFEVEPGHALVWVLGIEASRYIGAPGKLQFGVRSLWSR